MSEKGISLKVGDRAKTDYPKTGVWSEVTIIGRCENTYSQSRVSFQFTPDLSSHKGVWLDAAWFEPL